MGRKVYTNSFAGGEISSLMFGHVEDVGYRTGWAPGGRNMIALPTGAATKRPGFEFVHTAKSGSTPRLFPFVYGDGDAYAMEFGADYLRLHANGELVLVDPLTPAFITTKQIASYDFGNERFDTSVSHGLATGDEVQFGGTAGAVLPNGIAFYTVYFAIVVDANTLSVATTRENALAGTAILLATGAESGTHFIHRVYRKGDLVAYPNVGSQPYYCATDALYGTVPLQPAAQTFTAAAATNLFTAVAHGLFQGTEITFDNTGGTLPTPIVEGTIYYTIPQTANTFAVSLTPGGSAVDLLADSASNPTFQRYQNWYTEPADGSDYIYEIPHGLGVDGLAALGYDQSLDDWPFASIHGPSYRLSREVTTVEGNIGFVFRILDTSPGPDAPTLSMTTRNFGERYTITWGDGAPTATSLAVVDGTTPHTLIPGYVVYMEASLGTGSAITGVAGTPGFCLVTQIGTGATPQDVRFRRVDGGAEMLNTSGVDQPGVVRVVGSSSRLTESYVVTAMRDGEESLASNVVVVTNDLEVPGSSNVMSWTAVEGAQRYRLYKELDAVYGLVIETDLLTATDDNIGPDFEVQPPTYDNDLETEFPSSVAFFQQRPWFGGTEESPRGVWAGVTNTVATMTYHERVLLDTDRIRLNVAARERTLVRHLVPMTRLMVMTSSAEIRLGGAASGVLSPVNPIEAEAVSQVGCTGVRPIVRNSSLMFVGARNQHVYELQPQPTVVQKPDDLSIRASHLFDDNEIEQSAQQDSPVPIDWWVRDDGSLLGMTNMPEQNIRGWHLHAAAGTDAEILSVCVIPDDDGQRLYAVIRRTINDSTAIHIERMGRIEAPETLTACKYLDSVVTYTGALTVTIPVAHLEGEVVYAVADGKLQGPFTVAAGIITLTKAATTAHVGLMFDPLFRTLPAAMLIDGFGKGRQLNVKEATLRVDTSCAFKVAIYQDDDEEHGITRTAWPAVGVDNFRMRSKDVPVPVEGSWNRNAQVEITQENTPFPLTVVSVSLDVEVGGPS